MTYSVDILCITETSNVYLQNTFIIMWSKDWKCFSNIFWKCSPFHLHFGSVYTPVFFKNVRKRGFRMVKQSCEIKISNSYRYPWLFKNNSYFKEIGEKQFTIVKMSFFIELMDSIISFYDFIIYHLFNVMEYKFYQVYLG